MARSVCAAAHQLACDDGWSVASVILPRRVVRIAGPHIATPPAQNRHKTKLEGPLPLAIHNRREVVAVYRTALAAVLVSPALLFAISTAQAESGLASYYGGRGHPGEMTCAHRTRPFGSIITVTYAGHSIRCVVNDRGPFVRGRIVDVSTSAARALGMMRSGVVHVSIQ